MTDEQARDERIADAEARQEELHADGGTVDERLDRLAALKADILGSDVPATE